MCYLEICTYVEKHFERQNNGLNKKGEDSGSPGEERGDVVNREAPVHKVIFDDERCEG